MFIVLLKRRRRKRTFFQALDISHPKKISGLALHLIFHRFSPLFDKGDHPPKSHVVFCPNKQRYFELFMCLDHCFVVLLFVVGLFAFRPVVCVCGGGGGGGGVPTDEQSFLTDRSEDLENATTPDPVTTVRS